MSAPQYPQATWQPNMAAAAPAAQRFPGGKLPALGQIFSELMGTFMAQLGSYVMAGLGLLVVVFPLAFGIILVVYGGVFALVFGLVAAGGSGGGDSSLLTAGVLGGTFVLIFVLVMMMNALVAPFAASLVRALARHQRGEEQLRFGSIFSTAKQDLGRVVGSMLLVGMLAMLGALLCYFPAFLVAFFFMLSFPLAALHRVPAGASLKLSMAAVRQNIGWHLKFFGMLLLMNMISGYVPVVGPIFALAFIVRVYRERMGDGEHPVIELQP